MRDAVKEIGGAVERIDDPAVGAVRPLDLLALLAEEAVGRAGLHELLTDDPLGLAVRLRNVVGRAFQGNLQVLYFAEIACQRLAGLEDGLDHDIEKGGAGHTAIPLAKAGRDRSTGH